MSSLSKLANDFLDQSSNSEAKLVKNNNEVLKEISSLKDFKDRVELAEEQEDWEKLGEGSSRIIYQISDSLVLKIATCDAGLDQCKSEIKMRSPCLNNVLVADPEYKWLIVRFTETMTEDDFKDAVGISFKTFSSTLYYHWNNEAHDNKPDEYEEILKNPLFKCISALVNNNDLQVGDACKSSSWGMLDGKPLLRDFGLTKDVFRDHYDGVSGNETNTP